jgi:hypothetical protein
MIASSITQAFLLKSFRLHVQEVPPQSILFRLKRFLRSAPRLFATIGTSGNATRRLVVIGVGTGFVVNAEESIEPVMSPHVSQSSRLDDANQPTTMQPPSSLASRTRTISPSNKRKATDNLSSPSFHRGYAWSDSMHNMSPSALYTTTAPPLPVVPPDLLRDPKIQACLEAYGDHIKVETPFDVDKLDTMLSSHPNQPFVASVLTGLRDGFWPLDDGEWKIELEEVIDNYSTDERDLEAIRAFRDREIGAGRWSEEVSELLPGAKVSPLFVVWQNSKPRVVTDHAASGLNDGISREEAKVRYDDMRSFGQSLHNARQLNPGRRLVTFKNDVAKAFLNLPAHPLWQLRQLVRIDGKLYIVRRLVFGNRASPRIWCAVSGLICWIAIFKLDIVDLHVYMDDYFGWDFADSLLRYRGELRPR